MSMIRILVCIALVTVSSLAGAQPAPEPPRPWAEGVPETEQAIALAFYDAGNKEFFESRFAQAMTQYREAIKHWDHPAIRFNMAVCLINLGEPLEAYDNLQRGMAYGGEAIGDDLYRQGTTYKALLESQLTRVTIRCSEPGADVSLDGKHVFTGPGEASPFLRPGDHQVVATKPGYLTASETLTLDPGASTTFDVRLIAFKSVQTMVRRWPRWKPYAVLGAGAALAAIGGVTYAISSSTFADYDDHVREVCPTGCNAAQAATHPELADTKGRAERYQTVAFSLFAVGGAVAIVGAVGLYLNQPRAQLRPTDVAPGVTPVTGGAMLTLGGGF